MKYAPIYFKPGDFAPLNGQLPSAAHAGELDAFACWLATRRLPSLPSIGTPMNGNTYSEYIHIPQYSEHIGLLLFAAGEGTVTITSTSDTFSVQLQVSTGGVDRDDATYHYCSQALADVSSHNLTRAIDVSDAATDAVEVLTFVVPSTVYVWEVVPYILPRFFDNVLPAGASSSGGSVSYFSSSVPVGYWNMEDGSGDIVSDVSSAGNSLDGTKASAQTGQPAWDTSTQVLGSTSLSFDHSDDDAVIVPDDDVLDFSTDDPFSISCWIKRPGSADAGTVVGMVTKMAQASSVDSPFEGYAVWFNDTQQRRPCFLLLRNNPSLQQLRVQASSLAFSDTDTDWHHILVTYDGGSDLSGVTMYIDGSSVAIELESSDTLPPGTDITTSTGLCFGGFINNTSNNSRIFSFTGHMDEIAIWSKELSSGEVAAVWNNGNAADLTNGIPSP